MNELPTTQQQIIVETIAARFGTQKKNVADIVSFDGYRMARRVRDDGTEVFREICWDCDGTGYRHGYEFSDGSRCWPCNYSGLRGTIAEGRPDEVADRMRRRAAEDARRIAQWEAADRRRAELDKADHDAWIAAHPQLAEPIRIVCAAWALWDDASRNPDARPQKFDYSDHVADLAHAAQCRALTEKETALLAVGYVRDKARLDGRAAKAKAGQWIGEQGEKITFTAKLIYAEETRNSYGRTSTLHIMETTEGNTVKWNRSGFWKPVKGCTVTVTAKVTKLDQSAKYGKATVVGFGKITHVELDGKVLKDYEEDGSVAE